MKVRNSAVFHIQFHRNHLQVIFFLVVLACFAFSSFAEEIAKEQMKRVSC
jgi:hypothetical protein